MAAKVVVKQIGGEEVGVITQTPGGHLQITANVPELQVELESLVRAVSQKPLTYTYGVAEVGEGRAMNKTISKSVSAGDQHYLQALADALSQSHAVLRGRRIRGFVLNS